MLIIFQFEKKNNFLTNFSVNSSFLGWIKNTSCSKKLTINQEHTFYNFFFKIYVISCTSQQEQHLTIHYQWNLWITDLETQNRELRIYIYIYKELWTQRPYKRLFLIRRRIETTSIRFYLIFIMRMWSMSFQFMNIVQFLYSQRTSLSLTPMVWRLN